MIHPMTGNQPIDYARAESADVVRKKHRRRVVMFGVMTVVVTLIATGWVKSWTNYTRLISSKLKLPFAVSSTEGWLVLLGPRRSTRLNMNWNMGTNRYENLTIGIQIARIDLRGWPKWMVAIRYRTLFILALIPWIITLIRTIRRWKWKSALASAEA